MLDSELKTQRPVFSINAIQRSNRKTFSIQVTYDGRINIKVPQKASMNDIYFIINKNENWIRKKIAYYQNNPPVFHNFDEGEKFFYFGMEYPLILTDEIKVNFEFSGNEFVLNKQKKDEGLKLITDFYKAKAKKIFPIQTQNIANLLGLKIANVKISSARKVWGSCSGRSNINLVWRLIQAPPKTIDCIIVHELVHLFEMNHSKKYWDIVYRIMPDYELYEGWLNENQHKML